MISAGLQIDKNHNSTFVSLDVSDTWGVLPLIFQVVVVAAGILVLLPVLSVSTGRQRHYVLPVVDVMEGVSGVGAYARQVSFPFEHQQVLPSRWRTVPHQPASFTTLLRMILGEEGYGDVKARPKMFRVQAGFGQDGLSDVESQVLCVIRPGAWVQVKDQVVPPVVPQWVTTNAVIHVGHKLSW